MSRQNDDDHQARREIAVAISCTPGEAGTEASVPTVVASGRGELAKCIVDLAFARGIRVREDADLAELLAAVDVDSVIPVEAFFAVADILATVYRANATDGRPPLCAGESA